MQRTLPGGSSLTPDSTLQPSSNSPRCLEILLEPPQLGNGTIRHSCILRRIGGSDQGDTPLWYELPASLPQISPDDAEPFLIASVMEAMGENRTLHVTGSVSYLLLSNLHEFMVAWSKWVPGTYHVVAIEAASIRLRPSPSNLAHDTAVAAYSGGVDATCTLFRHSRSLEGHRSRKIAACALIHGFDITLDQTEKFAWSLKIGQETLDTIGVRLHPVRTNFREVIRANWEHSHGAALVSALQFLKPLAPACLIGSSKPYHDLVFPYGSNPLSDAMLSSDAFQVLHDGARFDRTEKIANIAQWPLGTRNLRVCWRGNQVGANCGKCEKCIRTKLSFLALGKPYSPSLGDAPTTWEILNLVFVSYAIRVDFMQILANCQRNHVRAPWVRPLWWRVKFHGVFVKLLHWKWKLLHLFGKV